MERLTRRELNGLGGVNYTKCYQENCHGNCSDCEITYEAELKLKAYEDAEEQGLLVKLPIKPGDTFWELCREHIIPTIYPRTAHTLSHCFYCMDHLGDFTFVTEDAAKEALEKEEVDKDVRRV